MDNKDRYLKNIVDELRKIRKELKRANDLKNNDELTIDLSKLRYEISE